MTTFSPSATGVAPDAAILAMMSDGTVTGADPAQVQPASLDLTLSRRAWRIRASFLPSSSRTVTERLDDGLKMFELDIANGAVLERGCVYLVELRERLKLRPGLRAVANPKSSTGRIDVFVRLVADRSAAFDRTPLDYEGPLYAEICPRTFSILAREGSRLNQLRFKSGDCALDDDALSTLHATTPLVDGVPTFDGGLCLRAALSASPGDVVGWRARRHSGLIDVDRVGVLDPSQYFDAIAAPESGYIVLDPDAFYILRSREALAIPPEYSAEMAPISPALGEFRVHYAGFFDPGFGWTEGGSSWPSKAVLEVRSHEAPFVLEDGQLVARLAFERMMAAPERAYGVGGASNYQGQGLRLSKHFRAP